MKCPSCNNSELREEKSLKKKNFGFKTFKVITMFCLTCPYKHIHELEISQDEYNLEVRRKMLEAGRK